MEELFAQTHKGIQEFPAALQSVHESSLGDMDAEKAANYLLEQVFYFLFLFILFHIISQHFRKHTYFH